MNSLIALITFGFIVIVIHGQNVRTIHENEKLNKGDVTELICQPNNIMWIVENTATVIQIFSMASGEFKHEMNGTNMELKTIERRNGKVLVSIAPQATGLYFCKTNNESEIVMKYIVILDHLTISSIIYVKETNKKAFLENTTMVIGGNNFHIEARVISQLGEAPRCFIFMEREEKEILVTEDISGQYQGITSVPVTTKPVSLIRLVCEPNDKWQNSSSQIYIWTGLGGYEIQPIARQCNLTEGAPDSTNKYGEFDASVWFIIFASLTMCAVLACVTVICVICCSSRQ